MLRQAFGDDAAQHVVGNQVAAVHDGLGRQADLGSCGDGGAEDVPCGDVGHVEVQREQFRLRALTGTLATKDDQPHQCFSGLSERKPS